MKSDRLKNISLFLLVVCILFIVTSGPVAMANTAILEGTAVDVVQDNLVFSTTVKGALDKKITEAVKSGMPITFTFIVKLSMPRGLWFDKNIAELKLTNTVKYNHLKEEFTVTEPWNGGKTFVTNSFEQAMDEMCRIRGALLCKTDLLEKGKKYIVSAKAELEKLTLPLYLHYVFFFVSLWDVETPWYQVEFTYPE